MPECAGVRLSDLTSDFRLDAEYYEPAYLDQQKRIADLPTVELQDVADVSDGNHVSIAEHFAEGGVRYLRGQDLTDFFISDKNPIYIPEASYEKLRRSHMLPGDVLLGVVGTVGTVGIVTPRHGRLTGNCKLAIIRPHSLPPEYLAAYLASEIGQNEIRRRIRGAVQTGLILPDLKKIPVVLPDPEDRDAIVDAVRRSERQREASRGHLAAAEAVLTEALGMSHLDLSDSLFYERNKRDFNEASRFGAEYFMPSKRRALEALGSVPGRPLGEHYASIRELFVPARAGRDGVVRNFDLSDAIEPLLDDTKEPMSASEVGSTKKRFRAGDVVISRLRSYLREIAIVATPPAPPSVGSSEFVVLRHRQKKGGFTPTTLLAFLRSKPIQAILAWSQDGSQHPRFSERDLLCIPVPDFIEAAASRIDPLVEKAFTARAESDRLLGMAKSRAAMILGG